MGQLKRACEACSATGQVGNVDCQACDGKGRMDWEIDISSHPDLVAKLSMRGMVRAANMTDNDELAILAMLNFARRSEVARSIIKGQPWLAEEICKLLRVSYTNDLW